jgi:GGDEF domain-containing protein
MKKRLDVLLSEVGRATQQNSMLSVVLLHFQDPRSDEAPAEPLMQQAGQLVCSHIRQTDLAVRYDAGTLGLVLGDCSEMNAISTLDHLRKVLANAGVPPFTAGIAEAVIQSEFDAADVVTEAINRVEAALQAALTDGTPVRALAAQYSC